MQTALPLYVRLPRCSRLARSAGRRHRAAQAAARQRPARRSARSGLRGGARARRWPSIRRRCPHARGAGRAAARRRRRRARPAPSGGSAGRRLGAQWRFSRAAVLAWLAAGDDGWSPSGSLAAGPSGDGPDGRTGSGGGAQCRRLLDGEARRAGVQDHAAAERRADRDRSPPRALRRRRCGGELAAARAPRESRASSPAWRSSRRGSAVARRRTGSTCTFPAPARGSAQAGTRTGRGRWPASWCSRKALATSTTPGG